MMRVILAAMLGGAMLAGCAAAPRHTSGGGSTRATEKKPYDFRTEGTVPATSNPAPVEVDVEEIPVTGDPLDVSDAPAPPPDTTRVEAPADSTTDGFRAQIFATGDRDVAQGAAQVATERLGVRAYTELDAGMYKVRVGDYPTRAAAEAALKTLRSHYYPDAWIVPARISVLPRTP